MQVFIAFEIEDVLSQQYHIANWFKSFTGNHITIISTNSRICQTTCAGLADNR